MTYLYIVCGAVAGAPLRYFAGTQAQKLGGGFPWGTLAVNVTGCFLIGLIAMAAERHDWLNREVRLLLITGFLGSYTTFSAFGWETYGLARADDLGRAAANILLSVTAGLLAVWAGAALARAIA
jgi:CrcB protein